MGESARARHRRVFKTAAGLHGVFNLTQARACGITSAELDRWLDRGLIERLLPQVYAFTGAPATWERSVSAAACWGGEGSAISHSTAGCLWGLDGFARVPIEISTVTWRNAPSGLKVHRNDRHLLSDITFLHGLPITNVPRTLLDLAGRKHPRAEPGLDHALRRRLTSLAEMWLLYERDWIRGRRGVAILRNMLVERTEGLAPGDSELEAMLIRLIHRHDLPKPSEQHQVDLSDKTIHVDIAYPEHRLAIECDSYAWHMDRRAFEEDRLRDLELQGRGWVVLRFTWAQIRWRPAFVAEQIRTCLNGEPALGGPIA